MTQSVVQDTHRSAPPWLSVLYDVLRVYDHRYLELEPAQRRRMVQGTRQVLGEYALPQAARDVLPACYRLRAFCIQHELHGELERLIEDEVAGERPGAVVVGGRVYAMYPYLRGVPRQDADITDEVQAEHILDALSWTGGGLRIRGRAWISQVEARKYAIDLTLRRDALEHHIPTTQSEGTFEAFIDPRELSPGAWTVHVTVQTLGLTRESLLGPIRSPNLRTDPRHRAGTTAYFTENGTLSLDIPPIPQKPTLLHRLFHRTQ